VLKISPAVADKMPNPIITVLIDTYNHERFIQQALSSVIKQDFSAADMEILVVDDGSTDRTPELVRPFESRVRLIRKENGGQASAFNAGIPESRGEIVAFLDGDDWWAASKLKAVMEAFETNSSVAVVGHGIVEVNDRTGCSSALSPDVTGYFDLRDTNGARTFRNYMCFLGTSRVAIRRSALTNILPIPAGMVVEADEFMSAAAVAFGGGFLLSEPLTFYRLHDQNLFQFQSNDVARLSRKASSLECLAKELRLKLAALGVSGEATALIVEPIEVSVARMRLRLRGGKPWETLRTERADFRLTYREATFGYRAFKNLSLLLTLLLPPRLYYKLRDLYSEHDLRRFRSWLGEPPCDAIARHAFLEPVRSPSNQDRQGIRTR
jgi:glycosyltransferase involved in cell wall biosynthesis